MLCHTYMEGSAKVLELILNLRNILHYCLSLKLSQASPTAEARKLKLLNSEYNFDFTLFWGLDKGVKLAVIGSVTMGLPRCFRHINCLENLAYLEKFRISQKIYFFFLS